jgi:hypothetical protein
MWSRNVLNLRWTGDMDELQSFQACVTVLADDDVAVDGNAERSMFPISWAGQAASRTPSLRAFTRLETIGVDG